VGVVVIVFTLIILNTNELIRAAVSNGTVIVLNCVATGVLWRAAQRSGHFRPALKAPWLWLAVSQAVWLVGNLLWAYLEFGQDQQPYSSLADIFYLVGYGCILAGMLSFPVENQPWRERRLVLLDVSIVMLAASLVVEVIWLEPLLHQSLSDPLTVFLSLAYPVCDLAIIWAMAYALFRRVVEQPRLPLFILAAAWITLVITDVWYGSQTMLGSYASGAVLDIGWVLNHGLLVLAGVTQNLAQPMPAQKPAVRARRYEALLRVTRIMMPYFGLALTFFLLILHYSRTPIEATPLMATGFGVLLVLVATRQVLTRWENLRLSEALSVELGERRRAQDELLALNLELERRIEERTRELRQSENKLIHEALHDNLTQLPNRILLIDRLGQALERTRRQLGYGFAVLFLDFDGFKIINDSLGHAEGDALLVNLARRLQAAVRSVDTVSRLGGDEFVILLDNVQNETEVIRTVERLQTELAQPFELNGQRVFVTASIGLVLSNQHSYQAPDEILRDADTAMYQAKSGGKARYMLFDASMRAQVVARLNVENELREAIEREEFLLHYQPILDLRTQRVAGFEALLRWLHPTRGYIPPMEFIPVAEETGLIVPIGSWVLKEATRQMAEWHRRSVSNQKLTISVNLSARQFKQTHLADEVGLALDASLLPAQALKLEITESAFMEEAEAAVYTLNRLRALGVQVQIDDFGTGYSSLSYLHRFPIDTLKVDRSFITRMGQAGEHSEIVRTIVTLAHDLGMTVIAEGVETAEQLEYVKQMACELGQGYLISKPLAADSAVKFLPETGAD
jgi:diguanylate cyclase (GGDEF)-like protein